MRKTKADENSSSLAANGHYTEEYQNNTVMHIPYMEEYQNNTVSQISGKISRMRTCKRLKPGVLSAVHERRVLSMYRVYQMAAVHCKFHCHHSNTHWNVIIFIAWSHVLPASPDSDLRLSPSM